LLTTEGIRAIVVGAGTGIVLGLSWVLQGAVQAGHGNPRRVNISGRVIFYIAVALVLIGIVIGLFL
jgi:hypothetical protein